MLRNRINLVIFATVVLVKFSTTCSDHEEGSGVTADRINCNNTITKDPIEAKGKFDSRGLAVSLKKIETWVIFNSNDTPSEASKWRIQPCIDSPEMGMLVWGEIQDGDYLQIDKGIYRGSSRCFGEPVLIPRKSSKSVLIGLRNHSGQSHFKIGAICFSPISHRWLKSLFLCKEVIEYVMDSDERFLALKELMTADNAELITFLNNKDTTNIHKCNILYLHAKYCGGGYQHGSCESS